MLLNLKRVRIGSLLLAWKLRSTSWNFDDLHGAEKIPFHKGYTLLVQFLFPSSNYDCINRLKDQWNKKNSVDIYRNKHKCKVPMSNTEVHPPPKLESWHTHPSAQMSSLAQVFLGSFSLCSILGSYPFYAPIVPIQHWAYLYWCTCHTVIML